MYNRGCIWSKNNCHTNVCANVRLLVVFGIERTLWLLSHCVCNESHYRQAHMLNAGLCTPPGGSKSRLKSRLTFNDLFIFICRDPIATTSPPRLKPPLHGQGVKMQFTHERKNMSRYHALQLLGKIPESLSPAPLPPNSMSLFSSQGQETFMQGRIIIFPSQGLHKT